MNIFFLCKYHKNKTMIEENDARFKQIVKHKLQKNNFEYSIIDIDISKISKSSRCREYICRILQSKMMNAKGTHQCALESLLMHHYQKFDKDHWVKFLDEYLAPASNFVVAYTSELTGYPLITGVMLLIKQPVKGRVGTEAYVRVLCSKYGCGGLLMTWLYQNVGDTLRVSLHTEPEASGFYHKFGYRYTDKYMFVEKGIQYPHMIYPIKYPGDYQRVLGDDEQLITTPWYGWRYYLIKRGLISQ
jgi:hypothetical protein